jgi:hypothetical protein
MTDQTTDDHQNTVTNDWYGDLAGDNAELGEKLGQFESFDAFVEDYDSAKNFDWRTGVAGDDDKFKSNLERFDSLEAFGNSWRESQQKIRSGQLLPTLSEDASEDEIKAFREQNNIPLEVDQYLEDLPDGLVVGEEDRDVMLDFLGAMHEINAPKEVGNKLVEWYDTFREKQQDAIAELDAEQSREATDFLRSTESGWGNDFRTNMNLINSVLDQHFSEEAKGQLLNGRYMDGRGFFNDPSVLMGLASLARQVNDVAPLIAQDPDKMQSLNDEIAGLEAKMADRTSDYWKGPQANQNQARYRELLDLRLKSDKANAA